MSDGGSITLYAKEIFFEEDAEDGMVVVTFRANGMDVRIIQTRHFFFRSAANAQQLGQHMAANTGQVSSIVRGAEMVRGEEI